MNQRPTEDHIHMKLMSQTYPSAYTQITPQQGETKPISRRNKRRKGGENCGIKKRKLSAEQVNLLEQNFGNEHKLESEKKDRLASELGLDPRQVAVWFQNRRARWKKKKLEEEYSILKNAHETIMVEKCHLETKLLKLKEKVLEAEKEIQRLLKFADKVPSNSPSSSLSQSQTQPKEVVDPPFLGEFRVEGYDDDVLYIPSTHYTNDMEWVYLYL